jgi:predicted CoA-binding protein
VRAILHEARTWVMPGLSENRERAAYGVASFLVRHGRRVVPVHPRAQEVLGEPGYRTVDEAIGALRAEGVEPDVVDCFVNSRRVGEVVDASVAVGVPALWLQLDVDDPEAVARARAAGVTVVVDRCPVIEWPRLGPIGPAR